MATTYLRVKCPHCGKTNDTDSYHGLGKKQYYGNPDKICQYCGKHYYDDRFIEIATNPLSWYENHQPTNSGDNLATAQIVLVGATVLLFICGMPEFGGIALIAFVAVKFMSSVYNSTHSPFVVDEKFRQMYKESEERIEKRKEVASMLNEKKEEYSKENKAYDEVRRKMNHFFPD